MEEVRSTNWCYRAEGNCSLVIYSRQLRRAYRILKVKSKPYQSLSINTRKVDDDNDIKPYYSKLVQYSACVIERLFGSYVDIPLVKTQSVKFMRDISSVVQHSRPDERQGKDICLCPVVLEMPDYAYLPSSLVQQDLPSFMFEFKPGSIARRFGTCRSASTCGQIPSCYYCVNKSLECQSSVKRVSRYCPQELFSGNGKKMLKCMTHLLEDINCPRNRLRFFKNGENQTSDIRNLGDLFDLLYPYFSSSEKAPGRPVKKSRLPLSNGLHAVGSRSVGESLCLPSDCVLNVFASAQYFGASTIPELERAYDILMLAIMADPAIEEKLCINGPYDTGMWRLTSRPQNVPGVSNEVMSAFITVRNYLIYRTAKDSSILVTIQPISSLLRQNLSNHDQIFMVTDVSGQPYLASAAIIDLDPKPLSKMPQYLATELKISCSYQL